MEINRHRLAEYNEGMLFADGFDDALIGVVERCGMPFIALYDYDKCVTILMEHDGMEQDEAIEYMEFNVTGAYMGENTPAFATLIK